jgi:hypothetical protein
LTFFNWYSFKRENWQYALAIIGVILMGILFEFVQTARAFLEKRWSQESTSGSKEGKKSIYNHSILTYILFSFIRNRKIAC